ncbi:WcaI family glycosyltransferase [Terrihabitans rhizophilus]|uniref:WcaI family glycosyltransferase n=1 Tax=Terrihabitans rhizophilus TaxID=3092662 RepID=A0ABU4RNU1_9HYPH|nr:WcaI family glycosyltransferase [Terrihabitans sp. PJ23]MDX6805764.1 WcaI family glycosyltransferase [Terrihabitans sp. PJ23]
MRLLVVGINYTPELTGIGKYTGEMCAWLAGRGHDVRVITAPPHYPSWQIGEGYDGRGYRREQRDGVEIVRCPIYVPADPRGAKRIASGASFAVSAFPVAVREARRLRPDVVVGIAPSLMSAGPALAAAALSGARSWLHVQDFEVDAAFTLGVVKGRLAQSAALHVERALLRRFDAVSTISPRMVEGLMRKGVSPDRVRELRNWVDTDAVRPLDRMTGYRAELGLTREHVVALYSGSMAAKQGLEHLAPTARRMALARPELIFLLCGTGFMKPVLMDAMAGLPNVRFLDLQPLDRLPELLATADIHLLPQRSEIMDLVMPSKLPPMLASGRPVVAMAAERTQVAVEALGRGLVVPPGDEAAFSHALSRLAADADLRRRLGEEGRARALAHWSRDPLLLAFEEELSGLAEERWRS